MPVAPSSPGSGKLHRADGPRIARAAASYARAASSAVSKVPSHLQPQMRLLGGRSPHPFTRCKSEHSMIVKQDKRGSADVEVQTWMCSALCHSALAQSEVSPASTQSTCAR